MAGSDLSAERRRAWTDWTASYRAVLQADGQSDQQRQAAQDAVNPAYIPRNHVMQEAIRLAENSDFSEVPLLRPLPCGPELLECKSLPSAHLRTARTQHLAGPTCSVRSICVTGASRMEQFFDLQKILLAEYARMQLTPLVKCCLASCL